MKPRWLNAGLLLGLLLGAAQALAAPRVLVQARLQPEPPYQPGSTLRLEVDLLTSTWFTQAPAAAALELPGALITPPNGQADKLTERIDGTTYFGLRQTYLISPTRAGSYTIPALQFSLSLGQASAPLSVHSEPLGFVVGAAAVPASAGTLLVADQVRMQQQVEQSAQPLKVGDRLTRRVLIQAEAAQAMLIPPSEFSPVRGLKRYLQPAETAPLSDGRGSIDGGQRVDSVSYVVEEAGTYQLPAIELLWWDSRSGQQRSSSVPAIRFEAEAAGAFALPFSIEADLQKLGRGRLLSISRSSLLLAGGLLLGGLLGYLGRHWLAGLWQTAQQWRAAHQQAWRASEAWAWRELRKALRQPALPLAELYRWQIRSQGQADLQLLARQLPAAAAASLQQALADRFAKRSSTPAGAPGLLRGLQQLRKASARRTARHYQLRALRPWPEPDSRNPASPDDHDGYH